MTVADLMGFYKAINFDVAMFNSYKCTRLKALKKRMADGTLDENLRMKGR
jgi:hypothetical protein